MFVELVEVCVTQEVNRVINVPPALLQRCKVCILRPEHHPTCLIVLHGVHYILLRHVDDILFPNFQGTQSQSHFLLVRIPPSEIYQPSKRWFNNLIELLECKQLTFGQLALSEPPINDFSNCLFKFLISGITIRIPIARQTYNSTLTYLTPGAVRSSLLSNTRVQENIRCNLLQDEHRRVVIFVVNGGTHQRLSAHINLEGSLEEILIKSLAGRELRG